MVASLKMYLSSFPECILTEQLYPEFIRLTGSDQPEPDRLHALRDLLQRLPPVNRACLRKLLGHLVCVLDCAEQNRSRPERVAASMAPPLIYSNISASVQPRLAEQLLSTLLRSYAWLFDVQPHELEKERKIQRTLLAMRSQRQPASLRSCGPTADMLVGVYLHDRQAGRCVNVPISTSMTADDLLAYVHRLARLPEPATQLAVFEVVAGEQLQRPLHYSESILELTLGWATRWPPDDARGNYLIVRQDPLLEQLQPHLSRAGARHSSIPLSLFAELRFSDAGQGRSFRRVMLELLGARCNVYKDAKAAKTLASWDLAECVWYLGAEAKRTAPSKFCITFVPRHQPIERSKDTQGFIGRVFAWSAQDEMHKWLAGLITAEHPNGVQPLIHSINLMD